MTHETLEDLLKRLRSPVLPPKLQTATLRYRFKLDGGPTMDLLLDQGRLSPGKPGDQPDCEVSCSPDEFAAVLEGQHNLLTAFMRGDVRLQGSITAAKTLYTFLRYSQLEEAHA